MTTQTVNTEKLVRTGEALAEILNEEGVICNNDSEKHNAFEKQSFVHMLTRHAEDPKEIRNYLEITYGSCVRLIAHIAIVEDEAILAGIDAYDHPWVNEAINYERLNSRLHETLATFSA